MWDDARQMNAIAITLFVITVLGLAWALVVLLVRQPALAFREVVITTPIERANAAQLETMIREELTGTFFTMDLERARSVLKEVPWVRDVALRRQWPHRLEVAVDEYEPYARWNDTALVDPRGDVFAAQWSAPLPRFEGPEGRTPEVAARYQAWSEALRPLALTIDAVRLSPRGGWQLRTSRAAGAARGRARPRRARRPARALRRRARPHARCARARGHPRRRGGPALSQRLRRAHPGIP